MRVKQTARKSTASQSIRIKNEPGRLQPGSSASSSRTSDTNLDPLRGRLNNLLQTKRQNEPPFGSGIGRKTIKAKDVVKVKPRSNPGEGALREIQRLRRSHELLIPKAPFHRLIREVTDQLTSAHLPNGTTLRYQTAALGALQEAAEGFLVRLFEDSYLCTLHAKRVTLFASDMHLVRRLQAHRSVY